MEKIDELRDRRYFLVAFGVFAVVLVSFTMFLSYNLLKSTGGGGIMATILFIQMIFMFFTLMMLVGFIMQILVRPKRLITEFLPVLVAFFFLFIGLFMNLKISLVYLLSLLQNVLIVLPYILGMLIIEFLYYPSGLTPGERGIFTSSSLPEKVKRLARRIFSEPEPMVKVSEKSEVVEKVEVEETSLKEEEVPEETISAVLKNASVQVAPIKDEEVEKLVFEDPTSTLEEEVVEDVKRSFKDEENKIPKEDLKVYDQMKIGFPKEESVDDVDSDEEKFEELDEIVNELEEVQGDSEEEDQTQEETEEESEDEEILFLDDVLEEVEEVEEEPLVHGVSLEELDEIEEEKTPEQIYEQVEEWQKEKTEVVQDFISKEESDRRETYEEKLENVRRFLNSKFKESDVIKMDDFYQEMGAETVDVDNYLEEMKEEGLIFLVGTNIVKRG